jgi:hypothetical protein
MTAIRDHAEFIDGLYTNLAEQPFDLPQVTMYAMTADGQMAQFVTAASLRDATAHPDAEMLVAQFPVTAFVASGWTARGGDLRACRYTICFDRSEAWMVVAFRDGGPCESSRLTEGNIFDLCHGLLCRAMARWN